jgi:hypothetical protein
MANTNMSHEDVKSIEDKLERSPSQSQPSSSIYSGSSENPKAKKKTGKHSKGSDFGVSRKMAIK